jgi:predicted MPP superfamily phosphohydrolase
MRGLPESLHGATVVHLTDLHGGFARLEPVYEEAIARVNAEQPDWLLLTGDYIDDHPSIKSYPMAELLRRFQAKRGVFGCFGNHDHRRGIVGTRQMLEKAGVHLLVNANLRLESGLWLAGIDDLYEGCPDIARTFAGLPDDATTIVLSHTPRLIEQSGNRDVLILSGHTHGGQIVLPLLTPQIVCWLHLRCKQVAGWYANGRARLYVNRGLGVTGKPFRYNCPAEIGIFRLVPDPTDPPTPMRRELQTAGKS